MIELHEVPGENYTPWHDFKEKQPENNQLCLVAYEIDVEFYRYAVMEYNGYCRMFVDPTFKGMFMVPDFWMPVPDLPTVIAKEGGKDA